MQKKKKKFLIEKIKIGLEYLQAIMRSKENKFGDKTLRSPLREKKINQVV